MVLVPRQPAGVSTPTRCSPSGSTASAVVVAALHGSSSQDLAEMIVTTTSVVYPVHVDAVLDLRLSRWLWLVKWLLVIPHYVVLGFLWIGFAVTSVVAFFAILFTGRYPRAIFTYNVGVLRWSWRVAYYAYGALGTDRYPPFTLDEVEDYPAHLSIDYPQHLSRGLVLVKWWLLAIPHYIIVGIFVGGGTWVGTRANHDWQWNLGGGSWGGGGLVGILVLIAAVILAVTGAYPRTLYDVILGMNRWALRVAAYAGLMTDVYPPFRLDRGGSDPGVMELRGGTAPAPVTGTTGERATSEATITAGTATTATPMSGTGGPSGAPGRSWTPGRIVMLVSGSIVSLMSLGLILGGVALTVVERTSRDGRYLTSPTVSLATGGYAITSERITLGRVDRAVSYPSGLLDTARIRVTATDPARPVFVGVAPTASVQAYLAGVHHATVNSIGVTGTTYVEHAGSTAVALPGQQGFWAESISGTGPQALTWAPTSGDWTIVVMNVDGTADVAVRADAAVTVPNLNLIALALFVAGAAVMVIGVLLVAVPIRAAARDHGGTGSVPPAAVS
jgi:hypothetical protein